VSGILDTLPDARIPAARVHAGWLVLVDGCWRRVAAEPELLGDGLDADGGRVRWLLAQQGVDASGAYDEVTPRRGERVWTGAPTPRAVVDRVARALLADVPLRHGPTVVVDDEELLAELPGDLR
jgi:hypothetical protein